MTQTKTLTDSFENLTSAVAQNVVKPVVGEAKKMAETAKDQIVGEVGANEQGQTGAVGQQQIAQMKQEDDAKSQARTKQIRATLAAKFTQAPPKKEETVQEKQEKEKRVEQFKLAEKKKKEPKPLPVTRAQTGTEKKGGVSG